MRVLTFSAIVQDDELEMLPGFVTEGEPARERGELRVEAIGGGRRPLATTMLPLVTPCTFPGGDAALTAFGLVAFPERATGLRVSLEGRVLFEQTAPRDDLEVEVEWPGSLAGAATVEWRASARGCHAALGYSSDAGGTWTPLSLPGPANPIEIHGEALAGGSGVLELVVTDGFRSQRIRSDPYDVEPKGWRLLILSPAEGATLAADQPVVLAGQGYHVEERIASFEDIEWVSSAGGGLGAGARLLSTLEPGQQTITARMRDIAAQVTVTVD